MSVPIITRNQLVELLYKHGEEQRFKACFSVQSINGRLGSWGFRFSKSCKSELSVSSPDARAATLRGIS